MIPFELNKVHCCDCLVGLRNLPSDSIQCCVTSPPYWGLRDYGVDGQVGLEGTPDEYVGKLVDIFREVKRVLKDDGVLWLNLGDSYFANTKGSGGPSAKQDSNAGSRYAPRKFVDCGLKPKDLVGIPWRVAFALQADGWWLRQDIIWHKPNPMPESVQDRCTKAHEYIFMLTKSARYYYDAEAVAEPSQVSDKWKEPDGKYLSKTSGNGETSLQKGFNRLGKIGGTRNLRSVWSITTKPSSEPHFATFPMDIPEICIKASTREGDVVLDPFSGLATTGVVAIHLNRKYIGFELNEEYHRISMERIGAAQRGLKLNEYRQGQQTLFGETNA